MVSSDGGGSTQIKACSVELVYNEQRCRLDAHVVASQKSREIDHDYVTKLIKKTPYAHLYILKENFPKIIEAVTKLKPTIIPIAETRDSKLSLEVSDDYMYAYITITRCYGGKKITYEDIQLMLKAQEIKEGILQDQIQEALKRDQVTAFIIAQGCEPINGTDSRFECLIRECLFKGPQIDDSGRVDFFELQEFTIVEANVPVMRRIAPSDGTAGSNVYGQPIPARNGKEIPLRAYDGTMISPMIPDILLSTIKGHPVIHHDGIEIDPALRLTKVDLSTGNVNFDGSVYIKGDIADNMTVKATGNVVVEGVVYKAYIKAGGDIFVKNGVIGGNVAGNVENIADQLFAAHLEAKGDIQARFIDNARLDAGDVIIVREYIRNSFTTAGKKVVLGMQNGKGQLIGGRTTATKAVEAKFLGTTADIVTYVEVGVQPALRMQYDVIINKISNKNHQMTENIAVFGHLKNKTDNPKEGQKSHDAEKKELVRVAHAIKNTLAELEELSKQREGLEERMYEGRDAYVTVDRNAYRNVVIKIKDGQYRLEETFPSGKFVIKGKFVRFEQRGK